MIFPGTGNTSLDSFIEGKPVELVLKIIITIIDENLRWDKHTERITVKSKPFIGFLHSVLVTPTARQIYFFYVHTPKTSEFFSWKTKFTSYNRFLTNWTSQENF